MKRTRPRTPVEISADALRYRMRTSYLEELRAHCVRRAIRVPSGKVYRRKPKHPEV